MNPSRNSLAYEVAGFASMLHIVLNLTGSNVPPELQINPKTTIATPTTTTIKEANTFIRCRRNIFEND